MPNPMLMFDLSKLGTGTNEKLSPTPAEVKFDLKKIGVPLQHNIKDGVDAELKATFIAAVADAETFKKEQIARGELDPQGNPLGTEYYDDGTPKRTRRSFGGKYERRQIRPNQQYGDLSVLRRGPKVKAARSNLQERWRCKCSCGKEIIVPKYYLLRKPNPKTHCGCKVATLKSRNPREYRIYMMIHQRCYNPKHVSYEHYRQRGITLHEEWHNSNKDGFKKFFEHVGPAPSQQHSLDRIRNQEGYVPGNLRWATSAEQRANQGDRIGGLTSDEIAELGYTEDEYVQLILEGKVLT